MGKNLATTSTTIFHLQLSSCTRTSQKVPSHIPGQRQINSPGLGEKHFPRAHGWERHGSESSTTVISGAEVVVVIVLESKMVSQRIKNNDVMYY